MIYTLQTQTQKDFAALLPCIQRDTDTRLAFYKLIAVEEARAFMLALRVVELRGVSL